MPDKATPTGFSPFQLWIYDVTRSAAFPIISTLAVVGIACVLGGFLGKTPDFDQVNPNEQAPRVTGPINEEPDVAERILLESMQDPARFREAVTALPAAMGVGSQWVPYEEVTKRARELLKEIVFSNLTGEQKQVLMAFLWSLYTSPADIAPELKEIADREGIAPRYANLIMMWLHQANGRKTEAIDALSREAMHPDAVQERLARLAELIRARRWEEIEPLMQDPKLQHAIGPDLKLFISAGRNDWSGATRLVVQSEAAAWTRYTHLFLASVGFLVWFGFLMQQVQRPHWEWRRLILGLVAAALGVVSIVPTMLAVLWQDVALGMNTNGDPLNDFFYFVIGVGLREELAKLVMVLPLVPFLLRAGSLEQLVFSACVGLGFGLQENLEYFSNQSSAVGYGRVLTANFLHMGLTGLIGLAFFDVIRARGGSASILRLLVVFGGAVLLHAVYDLFLVNQRLARLPYFPVASLAVLGLWFYGRLRKQRGPQFDFVAPQAILSIGLCLLFACTVVVASMELGFLYALGSVAASALGLLLVVCIVGTLSGDVSLDEYMAEHR